MSDEPTVQLHVEIQIDYVHSDYDTGIPLSQWNAMTQQERQEAKDHAWRVGSETDTGGVYPITPGATED